ncbi:MAG: ABC transporter permease [Clostridium sp.]
MGLILRIKRMGKLATLIILSLTFSLTILNTSLSQYKSSQAAKKAFTSIFDVEKTYLFRLNNKMENSLSYNYEVNNKVYQEKRKKVFNSLEEMKKSGLIYDYMLYAPIGIDDVVRDYMVDNQDFEEQLRLARNITMNYSVSKNFNIRMKQGRGFTEKDFKVDRTKEPIPIIIGWKSTDGVIGDIITKNIYKYDEKTGEYVEDYVQYEIIGIYDSGEVPVIDIKDYRLGGLTAYFEDTFTIYPYLENNPAKGMDEIMGMFGVFIEMRDGVSPEEVNEKLNNIDGEWVGSSYEGLTAGVIDIMNTTSMDGNAGLLLGVILLILSLLGAITMVMGHLMKRKLEMGVKQAIGANTWVIFKELFGDMFFISMISSFTSLYFVFCITKYIVPNWLMIANVALSMVISLCISALPILKISRFQIVDLLRRRS